MAAGAAFWGVLAERTEVLAGVLPYRPGEFYLRELPPLRAVLHCIGGLGLLVAGGYADPGPDGRPGLGAYAHAEFGIPVIGVAKSAFRTATHAVPVLRGTSARPLFVTAAGMARTEAADLARHMAGRYRLPDAPTCSPARDCPQLRSAATPADSPALPSCRMLPRPQVQAGQQRSGAPLGCGLMDNVVMPDLDPASVIEAVARDPRLRAFTSHGRIETMPARQSRRRLLLDTIAQAFEPGVRYPERRVSLFLGAIHADYAALRRYLIDEEFLSRSDGLYWRSGGTVFPPPAEEPRA